MELIFKLALPVIAALVFITNMITESIKKVCENLNSKKVALFTAIVLSIITSVVVGIYLSVLDIYLWVGIILAGIILGFFIAQVAETGYDGFYMEAIEIFKNLVKAILGSKEPEEEIEEDC